MREHGHPLHEADRHGLSVLLPTEAAERVRLSRRTLDRLRVTGDGPKYLRLGCRRIGYREADLINWLASRTYSSTSDEFS